MTKTKHEHHLADEEVTPKTEEVLALEHPSYEELELKLTEIENIREQLLRALADKENQLRRVQTELEKERKFAVTKLVQDLFAVVDSLELSIQSVSANTDDTVKPIRDGVSLTLQMLQNTLSKYGVQPVNPLGESFNPEFHEAMSMQESPDVPAGQVLMVLQKGYVLHERLVRPAMVIVSKEPAA
jgi:molecular chaperone GrpE